MIKKFLKSPFGYGIIWLLVTLIYIVLTAPILSIYFFTMTPILLWTDRGIALLGICIPLFAAFLYTLLFYKKTMDHVFKHKSIAISWGTVAIVYIIVRAFVDPETAFIFIPWLLGIELFLPYGVGRFPLVGYILFYPLDYGLITLGNYLAVRLLSKKQRKTND